jgi:hypothetical protein
VLSEQPDWPPNNPVKYGSLVSFAIGLGFKDAIRLLLEKGDIKICKQDWLNLISARDLDILGLLIDNVKIDQTESNAIFLAALIQSFKNKTSN